MITLANLVSELQVQQVELVVAGKKGGNGKSKGGASKSGRSVSRRSVSGMSRSISRSRG